MCSEIANLFRKKQKSSQEWEDDSISKTPKPQYRSYMEDKGKTREQMLLALTQKLEQENRALQQQNYELSQKHNDKISALSKDIQDCESRIRIISTENENYKQKLNGLQPVDKCSVAIPFCKEYEHIMSLTNKLIGRLIIEFENLPDKQKKQCYPFFTDLLYDRQDEGNNTVIKWYSLLRDSALVSKELAFDLTSKCDENSKLKFLQKYAFEKYYRMHIASTVLFAEKLRISATTQERRKIIYDAIIELIEDLQIYGISIDYIPINTILKDSDFSKYEIESTNSDADEENKVLLVRKYAVNRSNVYAKSEKTILVFTTDYYSIFYR